MIESRYWKEDLLDFAKRMKPVKKPRRWSEKRVVKFEKEDTNILQVKESLRF